MSSNCLINHRWGKRTTQEKQKEKQKQKLKLLSNCDCKCSAGDLRKDDIYGNFDSGDINVE